MTWSDAAQGVVDDTFAEFGSFAVYTPPGGPSSDPILVLLDIRDGGAKPEDGRPIVGQASIEVRAKDVAQPVFGGTFTVGAKVYAISSRPQPADEAGYTWKMWVE